MVVLHSLILYSYLYSLFSEYSSIQAYTLTTSEYMNDGQILTSQGGSFQLGFFSPSAGSKKRYLGIWYTTLPVQTVVWVANRDAPLNDTSGVLMIGSSGNLVIMVNQTDTTIWSSISSEAVENPVVEFLESGNLVLRELTSGDSEKYLWQSFDYPSDTLLPGMKLGWNLKTGINRYLSSWMNSRDPSHGDYTYGMEIAPEYPEVTMRKGLKEYYRDGSWNGLQGSGSPELNPNPYFTYEYVDNAEEKYFMYNQLDPSIIMRVVLTQTTTEGFWQLLTWVNKTNSWVVQALIPRDRCDRYAVCGAYSTCDVRDIEVCQCLKGFQPKSPDDWSRFDWSLGCKRDKSVKCSKGEGFVKHTEVKLPETTTTTGFSVNKSMSLLECRIKCLSNCSCMAYSNSDIRQGGWGCILWFTDLIDMRNLKGVKQDLYIRMAASELNQYSEVLDSGAHTRMVERILLIVSITSVTSVLGLGSVCMWKKIKSEGGTKRDEVELPLYSRRDDPDLPLFDLATIKSATNNFSEENKLGEGGFGPVYKGNLDEQEEIAVKRLSNISSQGINEFKNEVILISKLQHRNLVRILGCCIQGEEKMLIYEYMKNNSLDSFIFDNTKSRLLDWQKRFHIILGIARGLLYLHHDSRLRIVHRDLKASNVLLDTEMVAKISDFGMARIFGGDQTEARTKRVVGTLGYMSPEYAIEGLFSVKSDVFSFGVLVLEIISGQSNRRFSHPDHGFNLLGHAWRLWSEDKPMELVDEWMDYSGSIEEISQCIHIALLCVQKSADQRPSMSSVVPMLSSETAIPPKPQPPGFYIERDIPIAENSCHRTSNEASITLLEPR